MANTTFHAAVGAKIAALVPGPLGIILAFFSHFICDFFPEAFKDIGPWYIIAEGLLFAASVALVFLFGVNPWWMFFGALAANIPDIIDAIVMKVKKKNFFFCHPKPRYTTLGFEFQTWGLHPLANLAVDILVVLVLLG